VERVKYLRIIFARYNEICYYYFVLKYMNTQLQTLFETYNLSEKDRYDIAQIFSLLPSDKQQNLLRNFPTLAARLKQIEESMKQEQEILL